MPEHGSLSTPAIKQAAARIWREELGVDEVHDEDNFFRQGGHSALAVQVALRLRQLVGTDVELDILYMHPEFGNLAAALAAQAPGAQAVGAQAVGAQELAAEGSGAAGLERRELTPAEERIWYVERLHPRTAAYNLAVLYHFDGQLDVTRLRRAFAALVERHKALRTGFGMPGQAFTVGAAQPAVRHVEAAGAAGPAVARMLDREARQPFDLDRPPLIRALAVGRGEDGDWLLVTVHHLVCDGASLDLIDADLQRDYAEASEPDCPPAPVVQAVTQNLQDPDAAMRYWRTALAGLPAETSLPYDRPRPQVLGVAGSVHRAEIPGRTLTLLQAVAEQEGLSPFMAWAAAYVVGLTAAAGERDLTVVTPVSSRTQAQAGDVGLFVNTVPLRFVLPPEATARTVARSVRRVVAETLAHAQVPMQMMIEQLGLGGDLSRVPLGQTTLTFTDDSGWRWRSGGLSASRELYPAGTAKYELAWLVTRRASGVSATLEFSTDLFSPQAASELHERMVAAIEAAFAQPDTEIRAAAASAAAATAAERRPITELIAGQARERPDKVAIIDGDDRVSYAELDRRAAAVAAGLRRSGAGRGDVVAIPMARSANAVIAALGALRAGCAYLPLDIGQPAARTRMLIEQCRPAAVIADEAAIAGPIAGLAPLLMVDQLPEGGHCEEAVAVTGRDPACVICTSGSTGQPKAVVVPHAAISALVPEANYLTLTPEDRVTYSSNPAFDAVLIEVWGALTSGATLVVIDREVALTPRLMREFLAEQRITVMVMATSLFHQLADFEPDAFGGLRALFFGGEVCDPRRLEKILTGRRPGRLVNIYGPTENTTATTTHDITLADLAEAVPIGRPVSGAVLHVLRPDGTVAEPGEVGELYVGGTGLANGYHLAPALTAAAFVPDPFSAVPGVRLYRTGDFVRKLPDGTFAFAGRHDDQVKVRGFRVELGEIDLAIRRQEHIADVAVLSRRAQDSTEIIAFVTGTAPLDVAELTGRLRQELPDHMVPAFVVLDRMPISANGKIDRQALAATIPDTAPAAASPDTASTAIASPVTASPVTASPAEAQDDGALMASMASLWREILAVGEVGPDDDFIALGGQSIKALRLLARVDQAFGVQLRLAEVLGNPTLLAVTDLVRAAIQGGARGA